MLIDMDLTAHAPIVGDAFGEALRRCHRGLHRPGVAFEVLERDDGLIGVGDAATYFAPLRHWPPLEREVYSEITGRVLDLGCGADRHATVLAADGIDVLGVDPSSGAVDVPRDRGANALPGSATELPEGIGTSDTFLLLGNNVGLLGGSEQALLVLAELAQVATPSARVIVSGTEPYATDNPDHLAYHERNQQRGRMGASFACVYVMNESRLPGSTTCCAPRANSSSSSRTPPGD